MHPEYVDAANVEHLREMGCVFLCIDNGAAKRVIVDQLEMFGVTFIDVGMGLYVADERLGGIVRTTTSVNGRRDRARERMSFSERTNDDIYDKNIQVADLNALNALFAVLRWKKLQGFYQDKKHELNSTYTVGGNMLLNADIHEPN